MTDYILSIIESINEINFEMSQNIVNSLDEMLAQELHLQRNSQYTSMSHIFNILFNNIQNTRNITYTHNSDLIHALDSLQTVNFNNNLESIPITLDNNQFHKLQTILYKNYPHKNTNNICVICIENYKDTDSITILSCDHAFHTTCIKQWLCNSSITCPDCRKDQRIH